MIVNMDLFRLKSSGATLRAKFDRVLHGLIYRPNKANLDVWLRAGTKADGTEYYEMDLCYVDDVLVIREHPKITIEGLKRTFRLKGDKAESPTMYFGANLKIVESYSVSKCWNMYSEEYVNMDVQTVEYQLEFINHILTIKYKVPVSHGYNPGVDETPDIDEDGIKTYQELIGFLRWAIEIGSVDILLEVALLSTH